MEKNIKSEKKLKGIKFFNVLYFAGVILVVNKMLSYMHWTFLLIRKWKLPEEPFFSTVNLTHSHENLSLVAYLVFAVAYMVAFGFVLVGLYQLNKTTKLLSEHQIFLTEISDAFRKAGRSFLIFIFGTFVIDILLLFWTQTSSRIVDLFATETIVFLLLGYLLFFLSDVFKEGVMIKQENELTI